MKITHKIKGGTVIYDAKGIRLRMMFGWSEVMIKWSDIDFLCLTPAVNKKSGEWKDFKGNSLEELPFLLIKVAFKNLDAVISTRKLTDRLWLNSLLELEDLTDAHDLKIPDVGLLNVRVKLRSLSVPNEAFIEFLSKKTRFDMIVYN